MYDNLSRVIEVDIDEILPNRFQPRIQFDEEEILELSDSIKEHGVIQPLVVRAIGDKYEIVAGERRYKASVLAGKETVPVIVKNLNDKDSAEVALIENIQRKNLTPIEEALSYKKILDMGYITQENLATKLGKSQSSVANKIRLLNLSDEVQEALLENKISERHARSLLKLSTNNQQNEMLNRIISERLTVRKADEEIEKIKNDISDKSLDDAKKIIEKGEIDMNNNMFGMPNIPEQSQSTPSFDIFGGVATPQQSEISSMPSMPEVQPVSSVAPVVPEVAPMPEMPSMNVAPSMPTMESIAPQTPNFDIFGGVATPQQPEISSMPSMPEVQPVPSVAPVVPEVAPMPEMPSMNIAPSMPVMEPTVPQTSPIIESPIISDNTQMIQPSLNSMNSTESNLNLEPVSQQSTPSIPEFKMPDPIIVTDYSKQYDPVMPPSPNNIVPIVDFKEVISAIRECSNKIEKYGFKIDVEEYDLANLYQVIFKIEK